MANLNINTETVLAAITKAKTVQAGAKEFIKNFAALAAQKVTDALTADNAADQGSIDTAVAAINAAAAELDASSNELGAALVEGTPNATP